MGDVSNGDGNIGAGGSSLSSDKGREVMDWLICMGSTCIGCGEICCDGIG